MKAITCKYHISDCKGSRISAQANDLPRRYFHRDYGFDISENMKEAAKEYAAEFGWRGTWIAGTPHGAQCDEIVFVKVGGDSFEIK